MSIEYCHHPVQSVHLENKICERRTDFVQLACSEIGLKFSQIHAAIQAQSQEERFFHGFRPSDTGLLQR